MKTEILKLTPDYKFKLLGITSSDDDYRLSWLIAKELNISIKRTDDLEIINSKVQEIQTFSVFQAFDNYENCIIKIISNKSKLGSLIQELKNIDYLILIYNKDREEMEEKLRNIIKSIDSITSCFQLEIENLKSKEKLLF